MDGDRALTGGGDSSITGGATGTPTPEELFAALLPELREKGVFDMTVNVQSSKQKFAVKTSWYSSVESFKLLVEEKFKIPVVRQCLIYEGRILEDNRTLESYGLVAGKNVYLIVLGGPFQNLEANPRTANHRVARLAEYSLHSGASPAHIIQSMYDSDPFYREMMKSPALFRRFCSGTPMTEEEMLAVHLSLQWGVRQQQSTVKSRLGCLIRVLVLKDVYVVYKMSGYISTSSVTTQPIIQP